jgi:prevent-host-death family protein
MGWLSYTQQIIGADVLASLLDQVHRDGCSINITKRGRVVARLVPARDDDEKPWLRIRGHARWRGDPFAPAVGESDG